MKNKLAIIGAVAISALVTVTGCKKDNNFEGNTSLTINLVSPTGSGLNAYTNTQVPISFNVSSPEELTKVKMDVKLPNGTPQSVLDTTFTKSTNAYTYAKNYLVDKTGNYTFTIVATDKKNSQVTSTFTVVVTNNFAGINTYSSKMMGSQSNTTLGSFLATTIGRVFKQDSAKMSASIIDFVYYNESLGLVSSISSPNDSTAKTIYKNNTTGLQTWSKLNNTKFKLATVTSVDFDNSKNDSLIVANATDVNATRANAIVLNGIYAFVTDATKAGGAKKGLFKIENIDVLNNSITVSVKVQK